MTDDIRDRNGEPFFTQVTQIAPEIRVGMLGESPAILVGTRFARLSAPEAKQLASIIQRLAA